MSKEEIPLSASIIIGMQLVRIKQYLARFCFIGLLVLSGCRAEVRRNLSAPPEEIEDGWNVASPLKFNANMGLLESMLKEIERGDYVDIHSILVVKDGLLAVEVYFDGHNRRTSHEIRSATKSIGSILVGIAIDKGFLPSENAAVYDYFKDDYSPSYGWNTRARQVNLGQLLSMMSGYDCDDLASNFACENAMYGTDDWVQYALNLPFAQDPGQHWAYNSSCLILAGEIIAKASGMKLNTFAERYLFGPLGITKFQWQMSPKNRAWIGGGARMIPREMAKIGLLMQKQGMWDSKRILSEKWIEKSTSKQGEMIGGVDYCYLWQRSWTLIGDKLITAFWASGNGGQYIIILPEQAMVVVFTGGNYDSVLANQPFRLLVRNILPAFLLSKDLKTITLDQEHLNSLTGKFFLDFEPSVAAMIDVFQNDLRMLSPDNEYIKLMPISDTIFRGVSSRYGPLSVQFIRNEKGEISEMITYGSFERFTFKKN